MKSWMKVLIALFAVIGAVGLVLFLVGIIHWLIIGAVILGIGYVAVNAMMSGRKKPMIGDPRLHKQLKQLETDIDKVRLLQSGTEIAKGKKKVSR